MRIRTPPWFGEDGGMRSLSATVAVTAALALGLSGCVPQAPPEPQPTRSATRSPAETPAPPATQEPADGFTSTPVTVDCNTLVSPQVVYDYNPNYGHQPDFTPTAGTDVATIAANQGVVCNWVNQTSGETFVVAVARLAPGDLATIRDGLAVSSKPVAGPGDAAFFTASGGLGVAEVFAGPYWLVAASPAFYEIAEVTPILDAALAALGR